MDDIYDNLDNFNEEQTIAELQTENKELKSKLQEYASTLDTLQKDFDKLNSEYKKLELNYSSLLKTAKAEIERKTQIISNLNLEKDKMVLMSLQKKNAAPFSRSRAYDNPMLAQNYKIDEGIKAEKKKEFERSKKPSPHIANQRKDESISTTFSPQEDIKSKLLNTANSNSKQINPKMKNSGLKENTVQPKEENNSFKSTALIRNRRKSMPAVSLEMETLSTDDNNLASTGRSQQHSREDKVVDRNYTDRQSSRISEPFNLENKNSGCHEPDAHKSRYDNDKSDRYRARDKSSHRYKNLSPDRYQRKSKEFHDNSYKRFEYDKHRGKRRVLESPPKERYRRRQSREQHRNIYERNNPHDHEKLQHHSQERYPMKHKIPHSYDESDNKRMKVELHYKQHENRRLQEEREFLEKKYVEPFDIQFSSCESPDYSHSDVSTHNIKEIKFTATTKLDDPRISNKKYVLKKNNGEVALSTVEGRDVDIVPINKIAWGITCVSMPEALVQMPSPVVKPTTKNDMEIENTIANISMESGELCNSEDLDSHNVHKEISIKNKIPKSFGKEIPISIDETKDVENSLKNIYSYEIPKLKKTVDDNQNSKKAKEINEIVDESIPERNPSSKSKYCNAIKNVESKEAVQTDKEVTLTQENKQENIFIQSSNDLPNLGDDLHHEQKYLPSKGVIEDDLQLSDDNCDNNEQSSNIANENICTRFEKIKKDEAQSCKNTTVNSADKLEEVTIEVCENKTLDDAKKNKNRNSADKLEKVTIEVGENKPLDDPKKNKNKNSGDKLEKVTIEVCENKTLDDAKKNKNRNSADKLEKVTVEVGENKTLDDAKKNKNKNSADKLEKVTIEVGENKTLDDAKKNKNKNSADKLEKVTIEVCENKTLDDAKKNKNKRKLKHKETKDECKSKHLANEISDNPTRKKEKETKTVQIKTKFSELFDDSSSLICPEDLGLASVPVPTERLPDKCVPFFEDALDATDLNTVKGIRDLFPSEKSQNEGSAPANDIINKRNTATANTVIQEPIGKISDLPHAMSDEVNESFYKNLEPGVPDTEENVVKTVIISSGVQPQVLVECEKQQLATITELQKMSENQALKALATSTPHKVWQSDKADAEAKLPDDACDSDGIRINSVENRALDHSDNKLDSPTNSADVPDVRIFVRRRRKVIKK